MSFMLQQYASKGIAVASPCPGDKRNILHAFLVERPLARLGRSSGSVSVSSRAAHLR